jgi:transcriptional regulator with XRE-family HTH domain
MNAVRTKVEKAYLLKVGKRIRLLRETSGSSQEVFAKQCNLDRTYISDIERGERNLSLINLRKIALALKVQPGDLLS